MMPDTPHGVAADALARIALSADLAARSACEHPILMVGRGLLVDADTGRILHRGSGNTGPISVRCRNRRSSVCAACSALYRMDAYNLIAAGLRGGKDTPEAVADRPRLFVTLTAPSFGRVHLGPDAKGMPRPCHPRRSKRSGTSCGRWHLAGDPAIGTPVDPDRYDYPGQVLFNAYAGVLWRRSTIEVRRALAREAGLSRREANQQVRVVFAKVAEFQTRGVVHFHAIIRMDGPDGPASAPPAWATPGMLETAIRDAAGAVTLTSPASSTVTAHVVKWGRHLDVQALASRGPGSADTAIARYVAKYATKAAEVTGATVAPLFCPFCGGLGVRDDTDGQAFCRACSGTGRRPGVNLAELSEHGRTLVTTCWHLGGIPAFAELRLRRWAHQVGYRGHFTTKSLTYSTTFAALRGERGDFTLAQQARSLGMDPDAIDVVSVGDWRYAGQAPDRRADSEGGGRR